MGVHSDLTRILLEHLELDLRPNLMVNGRCKAAPLAATDEESSCFISPDQMIQLGTYKKLYHASLEQTKGYVVQVRDNNRCIP